MHGHSAHDYPSTSNLSMSGGSTGPTHASLWRSGQSGPRRGKGRGRHVRFSGINVLYGSKGYEYPMDDYRKIYVPLEAEPADAVVIEEETEKETKK